MGDQALQNAHRLRDEALARLGRAKADLAQAQEAIAVAKADLERVNGFITLWHEFADGSAHVAMPSSEQPLGGQEPLEEHAEGPTEPRRGKRPRGNPKKETVAKIARVVIRENGAPMLRAPLFSAVQDRGFEIKGADPEMVFSTMLWRVPSMITRLPEFGYWLPECPYEPAGYVPGDSKDRMDAEELDMIVDDATGRLPNTEYDGDTFNALSDKDAEAVLKALDLSSST